MTQRGRGGHGGVGSVAVSGPRLAVDSVAQAARLFVVSEGFPAQSINNRMAAAAVRCGVCVCMPVRVVSWWAGCERRAWSPPLGWSWAAAARAAGGGRRRRGRPRSARRRRRARETETTTLRRWRGLSAGELGSGACVCGRCAGGRGARTKARWGQCRRGREGQHIADVEGGVWGGQGGRTHAGGGRLGLGRAVRRGIGLSEGPGAA